MKDARTRLCTSFYSLERGNPLILTTHIVLLNLDETTNAEAEVYSFLPACGEAAAMLEKVSMPLYDDLLLVQNEFIDAKQEVITVHTEINNTKEEFDILTSQTSGYVRTSRRTSIGIDPVKLQILNDMQDDANATVQWR